MKSLFLSHSRKDKLFVNKLANDLRKHGVRVWLDEAELQVGDSLLSKIEMAIEELDYLGVVLTLNSVGSEWVRREVEVALNKEISSRRVKVLPLLCGQCELPVFLAGKHCADFTSDSKYESALQMLITKLGGVAEMDLHKMTSKSRDSGSAGSKKVVPLCVDNGPDYDKIGEYHFADGLLTQYVDKVYLVGQYVCVDLVVPEKFWGAYNAEIFGKKRIEIGPGPLWGGCWIEVYFRRRSQSREEIRIECEKIIKRHTMELLSIEPGLAIQV
jgi:hypothetical protein